MERNVRHNTPRNEFVNRLLPPTPEQTELTRRWILEYRDLILSDVQVLRERADKKLLRDPKVRAQTRQWDRPYPLGYCGEIRNEVMDQLQGGMLDRGHPGLQAVKSFVREGGVIQPFWGIDSQKYFQNAIQIGDSILDVANDTVDRSKPPIVFYPSVAEAPIKRIEDFGEYASVAESYWNYDVYPNIYLPAFAPIFPYVVIEPPVHPDL